MKTIYLWTTKGWEPFDYDAEETQKALSDRNITIGPSATIGESAKIGRSATIGDKEVILKTICITGTRHTVIWYGKNVINIGCHQKTISWWLKNGKDIAEKEGYSIEQIEEYRQYVLICKKLQTCK